MNEFKRVFPSPPADWHEASLSDFLERVATRNDVRDSNVLTISAEYGLISQEEFFNRRVASVNATGYFRLLKGDFAYNKSYSKGYPVGAIRRLDRYPSGIVSPLYICFRPARRDIDSDFLAYYLDGGAIDRQLADVAKEGARNHGLLNVGVDDFFSIKTALPSSAEQTVIAQVLKTLDTAIHETEAIIAKLKAAKQGLLHDLLTRGIDANGELRPPPSEALQFYKQTPLGWIPANWEETCLGEIARRSGGFLQTGPFGSQLHAHEYAIDGIPVVMPQDMVDGELSTENIARITERKAHSLARHRIKPNDLVFSRRGDLSRCVAIGDKHTGWLCGTGCLLARLPRSEVNVHWLALVYQQPVTQSQVMGRAVGSTMANLNTSILAAISVSRPAVNEQDEIARRVSSASLRIRTEEQTLEKLRLEKAGLMDDLLTGRVRVTPLLTEAEREKECA